MELGGFVDLLLDDSLSLQSFLESEQPGEDVDQ